MPDSRRKYCICIGFVNVVLRSALLCLLLSGGFGTAESIVMRPALMSVAAEESIRKGVNYLVGSQKPDGSWSGGFGASQTFPCTMTSLAGLALMANGNTPVSGRYAANVSKAVDYILKNSRNSGLIASSTEESYAMYGHGFSMLFLAQAYGMENDPIRQQEIARVLYKAALLTARCQSPDGGWIYKAEATSDEGSVTVTQLQGLRACRDIGIEVPEVTIDRACAYIARCANKDGGISYSLRSRGYSRAPITAATVAALYSGGRYEHPVAIGALAYTLNKLRSSNMDVWRAYRGHTFYSILYVSQAMWFSSEENWNETFPAMRDNLIKRQNKDGSWKGDSVGNVFGTAIGLLVLQLPYNYLPILQR